ncbi:DUF3173 family protein [Companilactobacillus halodurans]|uniref:DUF3173 domain-containing protein n=1 Tax=Companilactobacillus halodurans TaxID=2584183 RepID=A0A5P0ZMA9_9LACO|nr:DUF3173 family protein [Companilactobacillus halodurans]MQS75316.1 DUF3173 domain-containing protein [Companilactobacillus halodurans]MQS98573.1 DUF3173 domain-containing protein [Companilactobacillus halodurans]
MVKEMVNFKDLKALGLPDSQARRVIREAKNVFVSRGLGFYNGKRVGLVPVSVVSEILGISFPEVEEQREK